MTTISFESRLTKARERFLSQVIEHSLECGRRTHEDFIRHFPPSAIMNGLASRPVLRANILVIATGIRAKIAEKKSAESSGEDVQIALDEGETDAETIVTLFEPDDRVRYLDHQALWKFVIEGEPWLVDPTTDAQAHTIMSEHMGYMIDRGLKDELVTHRDVVEGVTVEKLVSLLPRDELRKIIDAGLEAGHDAKPFLDIDLLGATPSGTLLTHVPLPWIWDHVIMSRIAEAHGFADKSDDEEG